MEERDYYTVSLEEAEEAYEAAEAIEEAMEAAEGDKPIAVISYRGYDVPVYMDDPGQQFWCEFDGREVGFGSYNPYYEEDVRYLIDEKLDVIYRFPTPYFGAQLRWFDNGGYRDVKLTYRQRTLKVFPVKEGYEIGEGVLGRLIEESEAAIDRVREAEKDGLSD